MKLSYHIGLNCVNPAAYQGWPGWLQACVADATDLAAAAARIGFEARGAFNEEATRENVFGQLSTWSNAPEENTYLVTSSGHGTRAEGAFQSAEALCLYDGLIWDRELADALAHFPAGAKVIVILDSCHSGGMDRARTGLVRACPRHIAERFEAQPPAPRRAPQASILLLTACRADETALDGAENGAFTGSLLTTLEGLRLKDNRLPTWREWFEATEHFMARYFPHQHPRAFRLGPDAIWETPINA